MSSVPPLTDGVDLFWLPVGAGAGGQCVRGSGRAYETLAALRQRFFGHLLQVDIQRQVKVVPRLWRPPGRRAQ